MVSASGKSTEFSATDSALGYLYQVRLALLSSLHRIAKNQTFTLYLETLDDVVFDAEGSAFELFQLKHHCERAGNLTDASTDLWKTLRVWIEGRAAGTIPSDAKLFLITTSDVGADSAASKLMNADRDETEAAERLSGVATTSTNEKNKTAYSRYRALQEGDKRKILDMITIVPRASNITRVGEDIREEARLAVRRGHLDSFVKQLEGWWFSRVLQQLADKPSQPILSSEIEYMIDDIRDQFKRDALPVDKDILEQEVDASMYEDAVFVHQVRLAGIGRPRILAAIRDYYRASAQRSSWMREELLLIGELVGYERLLREEWELQFARFADELGDAFAEEEKQTVAQKIYAWVENACYPIRPQVRHPSMTRGSFQILANTLVVGWHPDFKQRLTHLLEPKEAS